ncbi:MAG TPA: hypothetical protein VFE26_10880 [Trebonia sp.]|jgi:3-deoxy-D-manno-octulosonic-acid transferase|nr:hypothetical protein [Trebonia sp.]
MSTKSKETVLEKATKLVALANSEEENEARTAAVQLARLMKSEELVLVPRSEIERVEKVIAGSIAKATEAKSAGLKQVAVGAVIGALLSKSLGIKL